MEDDGIDVGFLKDELARFEGKLNSMQKKYKKMSDMLKDKDKTKEYMVLLSKAFYIQGRLSVLENGYKHEPDISYIG